MHTVTFFVQKLLRQAQALLQAVSRMSYLEKKFFYTFLLTRVNNR